MNIVQQSGTKPASKRNAKAAKSSLTLQGQHIIAIYSQFKAEICQTKQRPVTPTEDNIKAANSLGDIVESDDDFKEVLRLIFNDSFLKQKNVRIDLDFVYRKDDGVLDKVDKLRGQAKRPDTPPKPDTKIPMTRVEADQLATLATQRAKKQGHEIHASVTLLEGDEWGVVVQWNTFGFEKPVTFKSPGHFERMFTGISEIWQDEDKKVK